MTFDLPIVVLIVAVVAILCWQAGMAHRAWSDEETNRRAVIVELVMAGCLSVNEGRDFLARRPKAPPPPPKRAAA